MTNEGWYYFTFGWGQQNGGHYVKFYGTYETARQQMIDRYGLSWGFQYSEDEWKLWVKRAGRIGFPVETELK